MVANFSHQTKASNPEIQAVIDWLLSQNLPPLPVAPQQNPREYPKVVKADQRQQIWEHCPLDYELQPIPLFTGKNPSFLDRHSVPHLINHRQYQSSLPSGSDLRKWFANPANGIGTLGGHGGVVWLDFDVKQFGSEVECSRAVLAWGESHPQLKGTFIERTHSGGWRIGVRVRKKPDFTNFALSPGGHHVGEALSAGRFTVLAPTIGPSGNAYRSINRTHLVEVESLKAINIYTSGKGKSSEVVQRPQPSLSAMPGSIPLDMLLTDQARAILNGDNPTGDRSSSLTILIREAYGWENWANANNVSIRDNTEALAHAAGAALGIDSSRVGRILKTVDPASSSPAAAYRGDESSCWLKIRRLDKATYEALCPQFIKDTIGQQWHQSSQRLHPDTIEEVLQRALIVDVIGEHVELHKRGKDFVGKCPFHDEKTPSFIVSPTKQTYDCFGCGVAGNVIKFLMQLGKHSFSDVVLDLARRYQVQVRESDGAPLTLPAKPLSFRERGSSNGGSNEGKRGGSGGGGTPTTVTGVSLRDRVLEIINRNDSISERKAAFIDLAKSTGVQLREVEQLKEAIESDVDLTEGRTDRAKELESLLKIGERRLTLSRYLHPNLAQPLERLAVWMGVDIEALLTVLLPTAASLLHPETRVFVKECIDFTEPMVVYAGIVSESGNRKSPTFKAITKALRKLQDEEDIRSKLATEQYKADLLAWKQDKSEDKGDDAPEPPGPPREYFVDNITSESLDRIKAQQPGHGILIRKDELSGLFGSYGAYKGGKGSDKEGILSGWNGDGVKVNRAGGSRLSLSHDASSIVGAIQPGKLRKVMGDLEDEQGEWGRFLWYFAPLRPFRLPDDDTRFEVGDLLEGIYRKLDKLAPIQYRFTPEAQRLYQDYHWHLEQRKLAEPRQGLRAAIAKMQGYTARIAGILHILWAIAAGETPESHIPIERVKAANALAEFYLGQVRLIHSDAEAAQGELTPILELILKKSRQLGQMPTRTAKSSIKALRSYKTDKILECFRELEAMGHGKVEGKTFIPVPQNVDPIVDRVDPMLTQMLTTPQKAEFTDATSLQPLADKNVDHVDHFSGQLSPPAVVGDESLNNGQQSQQVNILDESLTQSDVDHVDRESTSGSTFLSGSTSGSTFLLPEFSSVSAQRQPQQPEAPALEVVRPPLALAPKEKVVPSAQLKVGDNVNVDNPGSKHHAKIGRIVRLKTERFQGQQLQTADLSFPGERRYVEVQLSWLRRFESDEI